MKIIHFLIGKRQPLLFPICLDRHRCEIRRRSCQFLVYHRWPNNRSLNRALLGIFLETSSGSVRPLGIMPVRSVFSLEVSGIYWFRHLGYNSAYRLNSLPRVLCTEYLSPSGEEEERKGMYDCSVRLLVLNIQNINNLCPNSRKAKTEFTRMGFSRILEVKCQKRQWESMSIRRV